MKKSTNFTYSQKYLFTTFLLVLFIRSFGETDITFQNGTNGYTGCIDNVASYFIREMDISNEPNEFIHKYSNGSPDAEKLKIEKFHTDRIG